MEQITATSKTFGEFLGSDKRNYKFVVPQYQRKYSWEIKNINELWEDITLGQKGYYIGNILLNTDGNIEYIVDGQQRMTTLYLIMLALYTQYNKLSKTMREYNSEAIKQMDNISKLLGLQYYRRKDKKVDQDLKLCLLEKDAELLQICIDYAQSNDYIDNKPIAYKNTKLIKGYKHLLELIDDILISVENEEEKIDTIDEISDRMENLILLPIYLKELSDVFSVFSSINSKGQKLTIIDLLKADYLKVANIQKNISNVSNKEALKKWDMFEQILKMENSSLKIKDGKKFIQNNYDAFYSTKKSSIPVNELLKKYQYIFNNSKNIDELMNIFIKRARIYALITSKNYSQVEYFRDTFIENEYLCDILNKNTLVKNIKILQNLDISSAYPLVMYLLDKLSDNKIDQHNCNKVFKYLINIFVRRNIIKKPKASNLRNCILSILRHIQNEEILDSDYIINLLNKELSLYLSDDAFKTALQSPIYNGNINTVRVILNSLERYGIEINESTYFDKKTRPENLDNSNWTIEHIFPQDKKLSNGWDKMLSESELKKIKEKQFEEFEFIINKLGNLTLTGYNSELSNHSFEDKKNHINDSGINIGLNPNLYLNKSIYTNESFEDKKDWTFKDINRRNNEMISDVINIFKI